MKYLKHPVDIPRGLELKAENPSANAWDNFNNKNEIHEALLPAQNYLCCYCEIELTRGEGELGFHIEHIEPKSTYTNRTFDFNNLLLSCFTTGHELNPSRIDLFPISCGHAKGNTYDPQLFIKPTDSTCENYFFYELDGQIVPHPELKDTNKVNKAKYTITLLNLNCRRLKRRRKDMIFEGLEIINDLMNYQDSLVLFAESELAETNNKYKEFITTRRQYFQDFIK